MEHHGTPLTHLLPFYSRSIRCFATMCLLVFVVNAAAQTNVVPDNVEYAALKDLFTSTNGATWKTKTNWPYTAWPATATAAQMATWYGITVTNGDITSINLASNTMSGTLLASIGNLTALTNLNIGHNTIGGDIPAGVCSLTNLTVLNLSYNKFTNSIPANINALSKLTNFVLSNNLLKNGIPDFGSMTSLTSIDLSNNGFSGPIPACATSLPALTSVDLHLNQLSGPIPSLTASNLVTLDLANNALTFVPSTSAMTKLVTLSLATNQITNFPAGMASMTKLQTFTIFRNKIMTALPPEIGSLTALQSFNAQENQIPGSIPATITGLTNLKSFIMLTNALDGPIPLELTTLANLETLNLADNQIKGGIPSDISKLTKLKILRLDQNQLKGELPSSLSKLSSLQTLSLNNNQLRGRIPNSYSMLTELTSLYLSFNQLYGELPDLSPLTKLQYFYIDNNFFQGLFPTWTSTWTDLRTFWIENNQFDGTFPAIAHNWTKVTMISVGLNKFTGDFPSDVSSCTALTYLKGDHNQFSSLPPSLLTLPALGSLNFSFNALTSMPNFSSYTNRANLNLSIQYNFLGFDQLEPQFTAAGAITTKTLVYSPQNFFNQIVRVDLPAGQQLLVTAAPRGAYGSVTWEKNTTGSWNNVNSSNEDVTQASYKLSNGQPSTHNGTYHWKITNTRVTGLTLQSVDIPVDVVDALPATSSAVRLYTGQIAAVRWRTNAANQEGSQPLEGIYIYSYDEKYQFKEALYGHVAWADATHAYTTYQIDANKYRLTGMSYDPNGNIHSLHRFDENGQRVNNFTYSYEANKNRLKSVSGYSNNYNYDAQGRATEVDKATGEDQYIVYDVSGKVRKVYATKNADGSYADLRTEYFYDDLGMRTIKVSYPQQGGTLPPLTTWYVRDGSGQVISIYEQEGLPEESNPNPLIEKEIPIYGSGKLGTFYPEENGSVGYELTDHLGNVRAVVRDDIKTYTATMEDNGQYSVTNPRVQELQYFENLTATTSTYKPMNHTPATATVVTDPSNSAYLHWISGMPAGGNITQAVGPSIALQVEPGDVINASVQERFVIKTSYPRGSFTTTALATLLSGGYAGATGFENSSIQQTTSSFSSALSANGFVAADGDDLPHAYLNYIVFDGSKNGIVAGKKRVGANGGCTDAQKSLSDGAGNERHENLKLDEVVIPANGKYIYIWVSNESEDTEVWFDDLSVSHKTSFVQEATDYGVWGDVLRTSSKPVGSIKDGLTAQYLLNGDASDTGGKGLSGTVVGGASATTDVNGVPNAAYNFDGIDDYIKVNGTEDDFSYIENTGVFSVSVFVRLNDLNARNGVMGTVSTTAKSGWNLICDNYTPGYVHTIRLSTTNSTSGKSNEVLSVPSAINDNNWHHIAVVGDGSSIRMFVDGVQSGLPTTINLVATGDASAPLMIGAVPSATGTPQLFMNGGIDEIQIFNTALSDAEVRGLASKIALSDLDQMLNPEKKYRYGYQGQYAERDRETGWSHFELREYDPVIGRWLIPDPYEQYWSPYLAMGNDPVHDVDINGGIDPPAGYNLDPMSLAVANAGQIVSRQFAEVDALAGGAVFLKEVVYSELAYPWVIPGFGEFYVQSKVDEYRNHPLQQALGVSQEAIDHVVQKSQAEAYEIMRYKWAVEKSGFEPSVWNGVANIGYKTRHAETATTREEGIREIAEVSEDIALSWLFRFSLSLRSVRASVVTSTSLAIERRAFSGTQKLARGVPNSIYTYTSSDGKAVSNYIYDSEGRVIYQVDFGRHGKYLSGHGHKMLIPGDLGSGHKHHIPWNDVPESYLKIPAGMEYSVVPGASN